MNKKSVAQNYTFLAIMLGAMILGALFGWLALNGQNARAEELFAAIVERLEL